MNRHWLATIALYFIFAGATTLISTSKAAGQELETTPVTATTFLAASRAEVWKEWTSAEGFARVFGAGASLELKIGGAVRIPLSDGKNPWIDKQAKVVSFIPGRMISIHHKSSAANKATQTCIVIELYALAETRCQIVITQHGFGLGRDQEVAGFKGLWSRTLQAQRKNFKTKAATPKSYMYFIKPTRAGFMENPTEAESQAVGRHYRYLVNLLNQGQLLLAGPCLDGFGGVVIFAAEDEATAKKVMENDPAVKAKVFSASLHPFSVSLFKRS